MESFRVLYLDTTKNIIKSILFMEFISVCMSFILYIIGGKGLGSKISFLEAFFFLNIIYFVGWFLSKRLVSIKVSDQEVIFIFYRFIFYRQEERYLLKYIELEEEKEVVRANVNWLMVFYYKDRAFYKENLFSHFTDEDRERIKMFFTKR